MDCRSVRVTVGRYELIRNCRPPTANRVLSGSPEKFPLIPELGLEMIV